MNEDNVIVPIGVIEGINNIANNNTASKEDIESVLDFK